MGDTAFSLDDRWPVQMVRGALGLLRYRLFGVSLVFG